MENNEEWKRPSEEELKEFMKEMWDKDPYPIEYWNGKYIINGPTFYGMIDANMFDEAMKEAAKRYNNEE